MNTISSPTKKELLQAESDLLQLAVEIALRQKILNLLNDPLSNPNLYVELLKLSEKRDAQKLKDRQQDLKEKDKERFAEREMALQERKRAIDEREMDYYEKKFAFHSEQTLRANAREDVATASADNNTAVSVEAAATPPHNRAESNSTR